MILIINICKEKLHFYEFVKPVGYILVRKKIKGFIRHHTCLTKKDLEKADKIIICGTSLKDDNFLEPENLRKFQWIKNYNKPILGICGGAHIIGVIFGKKIKRNNGIGLKEITIKKEFLGFKPGSSAKVYHLHNLQFLPEIWKHKSKPIYATLFHPEVRNKELIEKFCGL